MKKCQTGSGFFDRYSGNVFCDISNFRKEALIVFCLNQKFYKIDGQIVLKVLSLL